MSEDFGLKLDFPVEAPSDSNIGSLDYINDLNNSSGRIMDLLRRCSVELYTRIYANAEFREAIRIRTGHDLRRPDSVMEHGQRVRDALWEVNPEMVRLSETVEALHDRVRDYRNLMDELQDNRAGLPNDEVERQMNNCQTALSSFRTRIEETMARLRKLSAESTREPPFTLGRYAAAIGGGNSIYYEKYMKYKNKYNMLKHKL